MLASRIHYSVVTNSSEESKFLSCPSDRKPALGGWDCCIWKENFEDMNAVGHAVCSWEYPARSKLELGRSVQSSSYSAILEARQSCSPRAGAFPIARGRSQCSHWNIGCCAVGGSGSRVGSTLNHHQTHAVNVSPEIGCYGVTDSFTIAARNFEWGNVFMQPSSGSQLPLLKKQKDGPSLLLSQPLWEALCTAACPAKPNIAAWAASAATSGGRGIRAKELRMTEFRLLPCVDVLQMYHVLCVRELKKWNENWWQRFNWKHWSNSVMLGARVVVCLVSVPLRGSISADVPIGINTEVSFWSQTFWVITSREKLDWQNNCTDIYTF